jgi:hypothetical protein
MTNTKILEPMKTSQAFLLIASTCVWSTAAAQQVVDSFEGFRMASVGGPSHTLLCAFASHAGQGELRLVNGAETVLASAQLPMQYPAWIVHTGDNPSRYLVGGTGFASTTSPRSGWLVRVEVPANASSVSVTASTATPDIWPVDAVLARGSLIFLDGKSRRILATPHTHAAFPDMVAAQMVVDASSLPGLAMPGGLMFSSFWLGAEGKAQYVSDKGRGEICIMTLTAGAWSPLVTLGTNHINDPFTASGTFGFEANAPENAQSIEVRDAASATLLHSAPCQPGWVTIPPIPFLTQNPSADLQVEFPGVEYSSLHVNPNLRYGRPLSITEVALGNAFMPRTLMLPSSEWFVRADARTLSGNQVFAAVMSLALRNADGSDPVVQNIGPAGQQAFLNAQATFLFQFASGNVLDGIGMVASALADDPAYDGLVLLGQILVFGNNDEIGLSDITATVLRSTAAAQQGVAARGEGESPARVGSPGLSGLFAGSRVGGQSTRTGSGTASAEALYQTARQRLLGGN